VSLRKSIIFIISLPGGALLKKYWALEILLLFFTWNLVKVLVPLIGMNTSVAILSPGSGDILGAVSTGVCG
jgi:hypothetical protein